MADIIEPQDRSTYGAYGGPLGTFVGLRLDSTIAEQLNNWLSRIGISNIVSPDDLHVTLMYSTKNVSGWSPRGRSMVPIKVPAHRVEWDLFGRNRDVLVMVLNNPEFERRHLQLCNEGFQAKINPNIRGGTFTPHMTAAYSFAGSTQLLPDFRGFGRELVFIEEYATPIEENWKKKDKAESKWKNPREKKTEKAFVHEGIDTETISERPLGEHMVVRKEIWRMEGNPPAEIEAVYGKKDGAYIGDLKMAKALLKRGINPEKRKADSKVCSVGYSEKHGKWFGWSHRAIYGFKPGDRVKKGSVIDDLPVGYTAKTADDARKMADSFAESVASTFEIANERKLGKSLYELGKKDFLLIYRAVDAKATTFNDRDYVTLSKKFAIEHADHNAVYHGAPQVVLKTVADPKHVFEAYNPGEYFYSGPTKKGKAIYKTGEEASIEEATNWMYHGTPATFDDFKPDPDAYMLDRAIGIHFAADSFVSKKFSGGLYRDGQRQSEGKGTLFRMRAPPRSKVLKVYQRPYGNGARESDQHAIGALVGATVFAENKALFIRWIKEARRIDDEMASEIYDLLKAGKSPADKKFGLARAKNDPSFKSYVSNFDSGLGMLYDHGKREAVDEFNAIMKRRGIDALVYDNTSPSEVRDEDGKKVAETKSYIILNHAISRYKPEKVTASEVEQASLGIVYHFTSIQNLQAIVSTGKFRLNSAARVGGAENDHGKEAFFLSLTRSKVGGYHQRSIGDYGVLLELDYDELRRNSKIKPVDYWGPEFRKAQQNMNEMEERVFSDKEFLPLSKNMIRAVHILVKQHRKQRPSIFDPNPEPKKIEPDERYNVVLRRALIACKSKKIPTYIYGEEKYWMAMQPKFALTVEQIKPFITGKEETYHRGQRTNWLEPYYELYMKPITAKLSERASRLVYGLKYHSHEAVNKLKNELHNEQKSEYIGKVLKVIQKEGGIEGFIKALTKKWEDVESAAAKPKLSVDNPGGAWLQGKIEDAKERKLKGRMASGPITGSFGLLSGPVEIRTAYLAKVKGAMGEHRFRGSSPKLQKIVEEVKDRGGWKQDDPIMIWVDFEGEPFIGEGNHRVQYCLENRIEWIKADIRYFSGGEKAPGSFNPKTLLDKGIIRMTNPELEESNTVILTEEQRPREDSMKVALIDPLFPNKVEVSRSDDWWNKKSLEEQREYLRIRKRSKKKVTKTEEKEAPTNKSVSAVELLKKNFDDSKTIDDVFAAMSEKDREMCARSEAEMKAMGPPNHVKYKQADGTYTPERQKLHAAIIKKMFTPQIVKDCKPAPGTKPVLILTGGRPAAGKTSSYDKLMKKDERKTFIISADEIQESLPGYNPAHAGIYNGEAQDIAVRAEELARKLGLNITYDATMKSPDPAHERVDSYIKDGYDVECYFTHTTPFTSALRTVDRFRKGGDYSGRYVPPQLSFNSRSNEETFDSLKPKLKKWALFDNNGAEPKLIAIGGKRKKGEA